jgi:hypothetical protein
VARARARRTEAAIGVPESAPAPADDPSGVPESVPAPADDPSGDESGVGDSRSDDPSDDEPDEVEGPDGP